MALRTILTVFAVCSVIVFFLNGVLLTPVSVMHQIYQLGLFRNGILLAMLFVLIAILWKE